MLSALLETNASSIGLTRVTESYFVFLIERPVPRQSQAIVTQG